MLERKDPAIKLFGKTIPLPVEQEVFANEPPRGGGGGAESEAVLADFCDQNLVCSTTCLHEENSNVVVVDGEEEKEQKKPSGDEVREYKQEDNSSHQMSEDLKDPTTSSGICEVPRTPSIDKEASSLKVSENGDQTETSSQEKCLKKPDKILPCPRCNSMDTKFCYFNNYNVNQPRHFCKNCQRYWTAGGTMRNVPVGAGRRKNKNSSASHYRHIMISDALQAARANAANGLHNPSLGSNGTVLTFGSDSPLCEPMNPGFNLPEKTQNCVRNEFHGLEQRIFVSCGGGNNGDDDSTGSTITATNSSEKGGNGSLQESMVKNYQGFPPQVPCFPGTPWPYPWNSATPQSAFCPSSFPVSFYPVPTYWGCPAPGSWNIPCLSPQPSTPNPSTRALGKHSRDGDILNPVNSETVEPIKENKDSERCVWIPKTLRIDDPIEAAKSSIWATLGIKNEKTNSFSGGGLFKAFQSKGDGKNQLVEPSAVLQANPAALCRSLSFQEHT